MGLGQKRKSKKEGEKGTLHLCPCRIKNAARHRCEDVLGKQKEKMTKLLLIVIIFSNTGILFSQNRIQGIYELRIGTTIIT